MTLVYLGVGSNVGNRSKNIDQARDFLKSAGVPVRRTSPVYETEALCRPGQTMPAFLNAVFEIETLFPPDELLQKMEDVERAMGRDQKENWQPRIIDLDLLLYGDTVLDTETLKVPHPSLAQRWFVLKPLADLAPDLNHPVLKTTIKELLCNFLSIRPM